MGRDQWPAPTTQLPHQRVCASHQIQSINMYTDLTWPWTFSYVSRATTRYFGGPLPHKEKEITQILFMPTNAFCMNVGTGKTVFTSGTGRHLSCWLACALYLLRPFYVQSISSSGGSAKAHASWEMTTISKVKTGRWNKPNSLTATWWSCFQNKQTAGVKQISGHAKWNFAACGGWCRNWVFYINGEDAFEDEAYVNIRKQYHTDSAESFPK